MKRWIVMMLDPNDGERQIFQTDDLAKTIKSLEDYDLGMSINGGLLPHEVSTIEMELEATGAWMGEDHSRQLFAIDTRELEP